MATDDFADMRGDLHPDLVGHVREGAGTGMLFLHHKYVVTLAMPDGMWGLINRQYEHRRDAIAQARDERNWGYYVFAHERAYRIDALIELLEEDSLKLNRKGWKLCRDVWIDSENVQQYDDFWSELWSLDGTRLGMHASETKALAKLGDPITIWHGLERGDEEELGFSWTTSREVALKFAERFASQHNRKAYIASGKVAEHDVKAYLLSRSEFEIIAFPDDVFEVEIEEV